MRGDNHTMMEKDLLILTKFLVIEAIHYHNHTVCGSIFSKAVKEAPTLIISFASRSLNGSSSI